MFGSEYKAVEHFHVWTTPHIPIYQCVDQSVQEGSMDEINITHFPDVALQNNTVEPNPQVRLMSPKNVFNEKKRKVSK